MSAARGPAVPGAQGLLEVGDHLAARSRPIVLQAIAVHGRGAEVHLVRTPGQLRRLLRHLPVSAQRQHST